MSWTSIYDVTEQVEIDDLRLRPDGKGYESRVNRCWHCNDEATRCFTIFDEKVWVCGGCDELLYGCEGHPDEGRVMGETFFCDGSCR